MRVGALRGQVMMVSSFDGWPSTAITIEFWMWSVDTCRWGSPISYAAGSYEEADNQFLLFNYNDWWVPPIRCYIRACCCRPLDLGLLRALIRSAVSCHSSSHVQGCLSRGTQCLLRGEQ